MNTVEMKAQNTNCPPGLQYGGTTTFQYSDDCEVEFDWCWGYATGHYNLYIGGMRFNGAGCDRFDPFITAETYTYLVNACAKWILLSEDNPFSSFHIFPCDEEIPAIVVRIGKATCVTDRYVIALNDKYEPIFAVSPCFEFPGGPICYSISTYCLEMDVDDEGNAFIKEVKQNIETTGMEPFNCPLTKRIQVLGGFKDMRCNRVCE